MKRIALVVVALASLGVVVAGQTGTKNGEWPTYGGDLGNTRYSPLDQINAANFNKLEVAWRFKTDNLGPRPEFQFEGTPLMVKGVLYSTAGTRRAVVALDAATGELLWMHSENEGARGAAAPRQLSGRGLAYWTDGKEERILYVTPGYQLIALDAKTGIRIAGFGAERHRRSEAERRSDDRSAVAARSACMRRPSSRSNVVIVGAAHRSGGVPDGQDQRQGLRPRLRRAHRQAAVDLPHHSRAGRVRQRHVGEGLVGLHRQHRRVGADQRGRGARARLSAGGIADRRLLRRPIVPATVCSARASSPSICRPASASGTTSSCTTASGTWTSRARRSSSDITINGRTIKAVAQPTKQAFLYVFNRETGEPIWPIDERPVEKGDVPGEWYSPTQPFPTKPPAYETQGLVVDDLIDFTPELRAEAVKIVSRYKIGPIFTPPVVSKLDGPLATLTVATAGGGTNWPGGSFDPETHILYVSSSKVLSVLGLVPPRDPTKNDLAYVQGNAATGARTTGGSGANAGPGGGGEGAGAPQAPTVRRAAAGEAAVRPDHARST